MPGVTRSPLQLLRRLIFGKPIPPPETPSAEIEKPLVIPEILVRSSEAQKLYQESIRIGMERETRSKDYEDMILDATAAASIELRVDDAIQYSKEHQATVWVTSPSSIVAVEIEKMFDRINLEDNIWDWCFNTALYGDFFLRVEGNADRGVDRVEDDYHPLDIQRIDVNGQLLGFRILNVRDFEHIGHTGPFKLMDPWEFVHFRIQAAQRRRREVERARMSPSHRYEKEQYRVTTKYGVSVLEAARRIYKQLQMVEQSLIVARMTRALKKYVYHVQVGEQATPKEAVATVRAIQDEVNQNTGIKLGEGFEQVFSPLCGSEDLFIPAFGEKGKVDVQELGGDVDVHAIVDYDRLRSKFYAALQTPPAFLGELDSLPGSLGESALLRLEIKYARGVKRVQRTMLAGLTRLAQIHLAYIGEDPDPKRFTIGLEVISTAEEEERKSALRTGVEVSRDVVGLFTDLGLKPDKKELANMLTTDILAMGDKFSELIKQAEDIPEEGEEELGLPTEGPLGLPTVMPPGAPGAEEIPEEPGEGELPVPGESKVKREIQRKLLSQAKKSSDILADLPGKDRKRPNIEGKDLSTVIESAMALERFKKKNGKEEE